MSIALAMLDGSSWDRAWDTLRLVLKEAPAYLFSEIHFCAPTHKCIYDKRVMQHIAPITYGNRKAYSDYVLFELPKLVKSDHMLIVHRDGRPLHWDKWTDEFLRWDFCGAPWGPEPWAVGNGGFSIRSKRFADWAALQGPMEGTENEDWHLCVHLREKAISAGFTYAPLEVAARFSLETFVPGVSKPLSETFGFHGVADRMNLLL
jgi:hypothetical protein